MENKKNIIEVVAQAFYGNHVNTAINKEDVDRFILGYQTNDIPVTESIDRTIVNIPNTDNIVIVYNKYAEEEKLNDKNNAMKPLAVIEEENIKIYSRCIVCRIGETGELESLQNGDYEKFAKYLAE